MSQVLAILQVIVGFLKSHTMAGGDIGSIQYWLFLIFMIGVAIRIGLTLSR
jgi:hypothetical protein